jgi:hypothetical protein
MRKEQSMDTINWLHLRGLALLALLGLFIMYAVTRAFWQDWRVKRRTRRIPAQVVLPSAQPTTAGGGDGRIAQPRAWHDVKTVPAQRAA